jgi:hypothetical protein
VSDKAVETPAPRAALTESSARTAGIISAPLVKTNPSMAAQSKPGYGPSESRLFPLGRPSESIHPKLRWLHLSLLMWLRYGMNHWGKHSIIKHRLLVVLWF